MHYHEVVYTLMLIFLSPQNGKYCLCSLKYLSALRVGCKKLQTPHRSAPHYVQVDVGIKPRGEKRRTAPSTRLFRSRI